MARETILTLNAGSSSIKFALFESDDGLAECARGQVERIGGSARLRVVRTGQCEQVREVGNCDHARALELIFAQLNEILGGRTLSGVGHRVVHGGLILLSLANWMWQRLGCWKPSFPGRLCTSPTIWPLSTAP